ncbi:MAG: imidazoleglycerol-phosphate dehydratase HisB [bacterium]
MSIVTIERKTNETDIKLVLNAYGKGQHNIKTGIGFFDHMLELLAFHGRFDIDLRCKGDLHIDAHHSVEDVGIVLGQGFEKAIPKDKTLQRYASTLIPMDESLARAVVDISGRPHLTFDAAFNHSKVGDFDTELTEEFFRAFVNHAKLTLHLRLEYGANTHHQIEALFKAVAISLKQALRLEVSQTGPSSTKGVL